MPEIGQIVVEHLPGAAVVALCGEHDVSTVPALRAELDAILATSAKVIVDVSEATFIDSSVVGFSSMRLHRRAGSSPSLRPQARFHDDSSTWSP